MAVQSSYDVSGNVERMGQDIRQLPEYVSFSKRLRILVLGSDGFVGIPLCAHLTEQGCFVDRWDIKRGDHMDLRVNTPIYTDYDYVFWLAWNVGGAKFMTNPNKWKEQYHDNLALTNKIFPELEESGVKYTFVSSQLADNLETPYGQTKRSAEIMVQHSEKGTILRLWSVYGTVEHKSERSHVVSDLMLQALLLTPSFIQVETNGKELRKFVHMKDVCRALECTMTVSQRGTIWDTDPNYWVSIKELAMCIGFWSKAKVSFGYKSGETFTPHSYPRLPGWEPKVLLEDGIREMVEEYVRNNSINLR